MARNLAGYNLVKHERNFSKIDFEEAERIKAMATDIIGKPGVYRYVSRRGIEHHMAHATGLLPDGKTSMGPTVPELFMQSLVTPLFEGEEDDDSWHALISFLSFDERFGGDSNVRHVYDVDASHGEVLAARRRIFSVRNAPLERKDWISGDLLDDGLDDLEAQRALQESAIEPDHIDHLAMRVKRALARAAVTSHRNQFSRATRPADTLTEVGDVNLGLSEN